MKASDDQSTTSIHCGNFNGRSALYSVISATAGENFLTIHGRRGRQYYFYQRRREQLK